MNRETNNRKAAEEAAAFLREERAKALIERGNKPLLEGAFWKALEGGEQGLVALLGAALLKERRDSESEGGGGYRLYSLQEGLDKAEEAALEAGLTSKEAFALFLTGAFWEGTEETGERGFLFPLSETEKALAWKQSFQAFPERKEEAEARALAFKAKEKGLL